MAEDDGREALLQHRLQPAKQRRQLRIFVRALDEFALECSIIKVAGSEILGYVADETLQIHGGYGYVTDFPVERYMRDAKLSEIGEGTSEVQRMIIAKSILRDGYLPA